ncbi:MULTISPECIES: ABC transporter permease [unclassified Rhodococcus (in: high G+C Gram-positive bacteria)]|uniref:ABC transporter permease n=1 Tax=unclassified Rhodococcus (in: high G+C Gram-positive bacteria) TaxID=192944 RepID=UPI0006F49C02|nr:MULTISPECIES: ABC transporter permease [unclassified Rhodococcus (in: high G+C Gram-positive bacteria)]KQU36736.1 ABC transporter [Rhodococcus sp. Leaf225]KQU47608.1 ABC transporter [Rhodococcus sp. Leaf258]
MRYAEVLGAEVLKLRRSQVWAVVVVLPLVMAALGVVNTAASGAGLEDGWNTLWLRTTVFFGLFPLALGVAVLASLVWRPEHRGGNWNALMASATPTGRIVVAKTVAVAALGIAMLAVELVAVVILGKLLFGLPGMLPTQYVAVVALTAIAVIPLAALQSTLSMTMRSFAAPIAVAMVGAGVAVVAMTAEWHAAVFVFPYAVTTRASQLASGAFGDPGALTTGAATAVVTAAVLLTGVVVAATTRLLDRRDVHTR